MHKSISEHLSTWVYRVVMAPTKGTKSVILEEGALASTVGIPTRGRDPKSERPICDSIMKAGFPIFRPTIAPPGRYICELSPEHHHTVRLMHNKIILLYLLGIPSSTVKAYYKISTRGYRILYTFTPPVSVLHVPGYPGTL